MPFGDLRLSVKGTNNGRGFDVLYDFGEVHKFVEFDSKPEFCFIQPWMQFPSDKYSDECVRVSVELVHRFNNYSKLEKEVEFYKNQYEETAKKLRDQDKLETKGSGRRGNDHK